MRFVFIKRESLSSTDGISQFIFAVSDALIRMGHEVVCLTTSDATLATIRKNYDFENYPELETIVEDNAAHTPLLASRLWRKEGRALVAKHRPDLIVLNGALPVRFLEPTALIAHDLEPRKMFRNAFIGNASRILFKAVTYRMVDQLVVTCPELVEPVAKDSLCDKRRFIVIPTCIDMKGYRSEPLVKRQPVILHCGLQNHKKPGITLEAFTKMQNQNAKLVMVGQMVDPSFQSEINRLPPAIRQRIELPGIVSAEELKRLLTTSRVMSVPSVYKIPVASPTVLEALASHTPSVLSPSISRIVAVDGVNCFVESAPEGMAKCFDQLISEDEVWTKISNGCAETKSKFDSLTIGREYEKLARSLAK
jgi:glycosyltransferase involved in cell wall biosynthesis